MSEIDVRQLVNFAVIESPPALDIRQVVSYAVVKNRGFMAAKPSRELLIDLINQNTRKEFASDELSFDPPEALTTLGAHDTKVMLHVDKKSGYQGSMPVYYNRAPIAVAIATPTTSPGITSASTIHASLSALNARYGTNFTSTDVVDAPIVANATRVVLKAATTSFAYAPGSSVYLGEQPVALQTAVATKQMRGFDVFSDDPFLNFTSLILNMMDGADKVPVDTSAEPKSVSFLGSGIWLAATPGPFGGSSLFVNGTKSFLEALNAYGGNKGLGNQPFTFEMWVKSTNTGYEAIFHADGSANQPYSGVIGAAAGIFGSFYGSGWDLAGQVPFSYSGNGSSWVHMALTRTEDGVLMGFRNGIITGQFSIGTTVNIATNAPGRFLIGNQTGGSAFTGNIGPTRLTVGKARYTAAFTPPTGPF